ncbi:unnamed protein product [marine sediment metagenome]|uniref:Aminotransferase class I/classII domain-containing protein n=1 Tax=marine sediment metagenome TaxID=412755 RepID=X1D9G8_9ZZZZ
MEPPSMKLKPFELERMQSENEHHVEFNLSESGVEPLKIRELLDTPELKEQLLEMQLGYFQTNGTVPLREAISHYYPGSTADHIVATNGGAELSFRFFSRKNWNHIGLNIASIRIIRRPLQ